jgi:hypothetical protein
MKPIETSYKGYRFRSRLEARWAVFFDALGMEWAYERQGYRLPSGLYLPDFWFPHEIFHVEIKPVAPTEQELKLAQDLVRDTRHELYFCCGDPTPDQCALGIFVNDHQLVISDQNRAWARCRHCRRTQPVWEGATEKLTVAGTNRTPCCEKNVGHSAARFDEEEIIGAAQRARSARFEFGEGPGGE